MSRLTINLLVQSTVTGTTTAAAVSGASIYVYARNSDGSQGAAATVWADPSTTTNMLARPLTSDSVGRIPGWLDPGDYLLVVSATGLATQTLAYTVPAYSSSVVNTFNTRPGAVTLTKADVLGTGLTASDLGAVSTTSVGANSGIASLDGTGKLTASQLPNSVGSASYIIDPSQAPYNIKADCKFLTDGAMTSGQATLTCSTSTPFASGDVGKTAVVMGAGAGGSALITTIQSVTDSGHVTLAASASTTVSGARTQFGTPAGAGLNAAITAANAASSMAANTYSKGTSGGVVQLKAGAYLIEQPIIHLTNVVLQGQGPGATLLQQQFATPFGLWTTPANGQANTLWVRDLQIDCAGETMPQTTITAASNGAVLPTSTINVASTANYPSSGNIAIFNSLSVNGYVQAIVSYTGKTATSFTGCTMANFVPNPGSGYTLSTGYIVQPFFDAMNLYRVTASGGQLVTPPYTPAYYEPSLWFGIDGGVGGDQLGVERVVISNVCGNGINDRHLALCIRSVWILVCTGVGLLSQGSDNAFYDVTIGYTGSHGAAFYGANIRASSFKIYQWNQLDASGGTGLWVQTSKGTFDTIEVQQAPTGTNGGVGIQMLGSDNRVTGRVDGAYRQPSISFGAGSRNVARIASTSFTFSIPTYDVNFNTSGSSGNICEITSDGTATSGLVNYASAADRKNNTLIVKGTAASSQQSGTATLAAGTSGSIANTAITASSLIRLTNVGAGGTVGALSVALAAGTGFTINSSSGTDTSKVFWEIVSY